MQFDLLTCLKQIPSEWESGKELDDILFEGIKIDSRHVKDGDLFVALKGDHTDGHKYIKNAVFQGAVAVIGTQPINDWKTLSVPYIQVTNDRKVLAEISAAFYEFPAKKLIMIGVTGTDGKTTTANMIYQLLRHAGLKVGLISTVNAKIGDLELDTGFHVTTPEAPDVQYFLYRMLDAGLTHVVLETTSHGLAQHRVTACEFDFGVVTNITHEHLDYHGDYDRYLKAKARLFEFLSETEYKPGGPVPMAVLNADDRSYDALSAITKVKIADYSIKNKASLWAEDIRFSPSGTHFLACSEHFSVPVTCKIAGLFNVSNALAALCVSIYGLGIEPETAAKGISSLEIISGRMERINLGQDFTALVDFAHTPNALERALETCRQMTSGRVIAVFGSAGLRDREKRRMMAEISAQQADITILTAEDPRIESLDDILSEMEKAAIKNGAVKEKNLFTVPDRGFAIRLALKLAKPGDLVAAFGKGHEQSMCFGEVEYAWDDRTAMRAALAELLDVDGPEMPYLPTADVN
ncbi:MAG: UDP-N-acetylmuramoyl-L-alanyl-D-glutamate--2,6-diaminopimelate ligase [Anaerolineaceae bacterium]|nr:UDP-N-acetylmuramoyl-L-alanyl-D-glutamate--2,6-diaminopimelate ligase [Anaerolineaceae bacterium]